MIKNILIISAEFTGHGHKSITESLCEKFEQHNDIKVYIVDGFSLGGKILENIGKSYGPITRNFKNLWELIWNLSSIRPSLVDKLIEIKINYNFIRTLKRIKPHLILSVHPNFNGSIINILQKYEIKIPVITLIADLVSIYPLWADKRADYIISPTNEAKNKCIEFGISEEKIQVLGFPVRSRFYSHTNNSLKSNYYDINKPLKCLIMSGGEGAGNMLKIAETLLNNFNCTVKIIAGRNKNLKKKLEKILTKKYGTTIEIYGFIENIQDLMLDSDIAFTRGSPNVMMEAVACNVPIIITDALPGQEAGNPKFAEKYNIGVVCKDTKNIQNTISDLLSNNAQKLNEIKKSQRNYSNPYVANAIVNFILNVNCGNNEIIMSDANLKFMGSKHKSILYKRFKMKKNF